MHTYKYTYVQNGMAARGQFPKSKDSKLITPWSLPASGWRRAHVSILGATPPELTSLPLRSQHQDLQGKASISTTDSMGDVPRTDALLNKLACPREPTGSLSEAIYSPRTVTQTHRWSPASRASRLLI